MATGAEVRRDGARSLALPRLLSASLRIYVHRWRPHLAASIIAQGPVLAPTVLIVDRFVASTGDALGSGSAESLAPSGGLTILLVLLAFAAAFLFVLMSGAACQLVEFWLQGQRVTLMGAYAVALARFWRLAVAMLAVSLAICFGLAALGGILGFVYVGSLAVFQVDASDAAGDPRVVWLMVGLLGVGAAAACGLLLDALVRWAVFVQSVIIEGAGPVAALARSATLVRGKWRRTAGAMALFTALPVLMLLVLGSVIRLALASFAAGLDSHALVNDLALVLAQLLLSPLPAIGVTVLFYGLRDGDAAWARIDARLESPEPRSRRTREREASSSL